MPRPLPDLINPMRLVGNNSTLQGNLAVQRLGQLKPALCDPEGDIYVELSFARDENGQAFIQGEITSALWMICQRCMQPMCWQKQISVCLALVKTEQEAKLLLPHYEPLFLQEDMHSVAEIIEAEIILALPQVAMHSVDECAIDSRYVRSDEEAGVISAKDTHASTHATTKERHNPFAVLEQMKKKL